MNEIPQDLQTTIIIALAFAIRELATYLWQRYKVETEEDVALSEERQQYTVLMQMMMQGYMEKLTQLTQTVEKGNMDLVAALTTANETLARSIQSKFDQSLGTMTGITQKRAQEVQLLRTDVQSVPSETVRLLSPTLNHLPEDTAMIVVEQMNNVKAYLERIIDQKAALIHESLQEVKPVSADIRAAVAMELIDLKTLVVAVIEASKPKTDDLSDSAAKVTPPDDDPPPTSPMSEPIVNQDAAPKDKAA